MFKSVLWFARPRACNEWRQIRGYHINVLAPGKDSTRQVFTRSRRNTVPKHKSFASSTPSDVQQLTLVCSPEITQSVVLETVEAEFLATTRKLDKHKHTSSAIVILATPTFVRWLEDYEVFIPSILRRLVRRMNHDHNQLDVICACVDGLSPQPEGILHANAQPITEGFSILYDPESRHVVNPWAAMSIPSSSPAPSALSSLLFGGSKNQFNLTMPLANTLFTNSKLSTLLASRWEQGTDGELSIVRGPDAKQQVAINFDQDADSPLPDLYTPARPLTTPRIIEHGLGNIVRTIQFDSGPGPASHELEEVVNNQLEVAQQNPVEVWALIIPKEVVPSSKTFSREPLLAKFSGSLASRSDFGGVADGTYIGDWIKRGARLCRVLSGGGGWGTKQGLLSLDPQTHHEDLTEARFDFSHETPESQRDFALGNIAQAGSRIQFFVGKAHNYRHSGKETPDNHVETKTATQRCTVIGTAPSSSDEVPRTDSMPFDGTTPNNNPIQTLRGHFGCVTESGLFLDRDEYKILRENGQEEIIPACATKIDMPYSYFYESDSRGD